MRVFREHCERADDFLSDIVPHSPLLYIPQRDYYIAKNSEGAKVLKRDLKYLHYPLNVDIISLKGRHMVLTK